MQTPLQITFRAMTQSDALALHLRQRGERLGHISDRIVSCHVVVELAGHHHRHGDRYHVSIHIGLPGHELMVTHATPEDREAGTAYAAADLAFAEAERRLEQWVALRRDGRRDGETVG
jgi:ribosome-associated translation inhibitor RaiA